jgi:hypothetical protein
MTNRRSISDLEYQYYLESINGTIEGIKELENIREGTDSLDEGVVALLLCMGKIHKELRLMNARLEEALETSLTENDIE